MRIGIDIRALQKGFRAHKARGIGRYTSMLVKSLLELDQRDQYLFLVEQGELPSIESDPDKFSYIEINTHWPIKAPYWQRTFGQHILLPLFLAKLDLDFIHFCSHLDAPSFSPKKTLVTVMDIIPIVLQDLYNRKNSSMRFTAGRFLEARAIRNAKKIIAISQQTRRDLVQFLKIDPDKIVVIYPGIDTCFRPVKDPATICAVRARYGIEGRYFLYLGGIDERKNVDRLIQAFAELIKEPEWSNYCLVCAGEVENDAQFPQLTAQIRHRGIDHKIRLLGYVADEDLPALFSAAEFFVYTSLYEGFGLPVLEAMACGTPVVCSHAPGIAEIAGEAAILFDPYSTESLMNSIKTLLIGPELRQTLIQQGLKQATHFSWDKTAQKTLELYLAIYSESYK